MVNTGVMLLTKKTAADDKGTSRVAIDDERKTPKHNLSQDQKTTNQRRQFNDGPLQERQKPGRLRRIYPLRGIFN